MQELRKEGGRHLAVTGANGCLGNKFYGDVTMEAVMEWGHSTNPATNSGPTYLQLGFLGRTGKGQGI